MSQVVYKTANNHEYSIDQQGRMLRNGKLCLEDIQRLIKKGRVIKLKEYLFAREYALYINPEKVINPKEDHSYLYIGITKYKRSKKLEHSALSKNPGLSRHEALYMLKHIGLNDLLGILPVHFEKVKEFISGSDTSLLFINHNLERIVMTTPVVGWKIRSNLV